MSTATATSTAHPQLDTRPIHTFPELVAHELGLARRQWPRIGTSHEAYAIILEELDEFWDQVRLKQNKRSPQKLLNELVQTAAMCQRAAEDLHLLSRAAETVKENQITQGLCCCNGRRSATPLAYPVHGTLIPENA